MMFGINVISSLKRMFSTYTDNYHFYTEKNLYIQHNLPIIETDGIEIDLDDMSLSFLFEE